MSESDPFTRALERADRDGLSVRDWVAPERSRESRSTVNKVAGHAVSLDPDHLERRHILHGPGVEDPRLADTYRLLRTQILQRMKAHGWKSLAITSPGPKAGKTMTAINLAISIARDGNQRVVLLDCDLRKPSVADTLGLKVERGLIDCLSNGLRVDDIALSPREIPNLTVIPGRPVAASQPVPELLNSARMLELLGRVARSAEPTVVLVDLPPVFIGDDVIVLASRLDGLLLVVEEGVTDVGELEEAARLVSGFNLLGTVLNKSTEKPKDVSGYYHG